MAKPASSPRERRSYLARQPDRPAMAAATASQVAATNSPKEKTMHAKVETPCDVEMFNLNRILTDRYKIQIEDLKSRMAGLYRIIVAEDLDKSGKFASHKYYGA